MGWRDHHNQAEKCAGFRLLNRFDTDSCPRGSLSNYAQHVAGGGGGGGNVAKVEDRCKKSESTRA